MLKLVKEFIFDNKSSEDFNLIIKSSNHSSVPFVSYEEIEIPGRDGEVIINNNCYKNRKINVVVYIDNMNSNETIHEYARRIKKWLQSDMKYKKLIFDDDSDFYLEAICINQLDFEKIIENFSEMQLTFLCKPYKKYINENKITLISSRKIYNSYMKSKPKIKVIGSGNITLNINNQQVILKGIESEIEIDSEIMNAYKVVDGKMILQNNKMYSDFPILEEGQNSISWTGNVTKVEIIPRWAVL